MGFSPPLFVPTTQRPTHGNGGPGPTLRMGSGSLHFLTWPCINDKARIASLVVEGVAVRLALRQLSVGLCQHRVDGLADELLLRLGQPTELFQLLLQLRRRHALTGLCRFADQIFGAATCAKVEPSFDEKRAVYRCTLRRSHWCYGLRRRGSSSA